jgi:hypothetical protein
MGDGKVGMRIRRGERGSTFTFDISPASLLPGISIPAKIGNGRGRADNISVSWAFGLNNRNLR